MNKVKLLIQLKYNLLNKIIKNNKSVI